MSADPVIAGWFSIFGTIYAATSLGAATWGCYLYAKMNRPKRGITHGDKILLMALLSAMFVWGLTGALYFWIASGGPSFVRWLVYPFCAAQLFVAKLDLLRLFEKGPRRKAYKMIQRFAYILVVLTVLPGVIGDFFAPTTAWWQTASFVAAAIRQAILFVLLWISAPKVSRYEAQKTAYTVSMISFIAWTAYPVLFALRFYFGAITPRSEAIGYLLTDILTKIAFKIFAVYFAYRYGEKMCKKVYAAKDEAPHDYYMKPIDEHGDAVANLM